MRAKKLPGDTGSQGYWYSSIYVLNTSRLSGDENLCTSAIYCIAWAFLSFQQAKTSNSDKYRVTEQSVCR